MTDTELDEMTSLGDFEPKPNTALTDECDFMLEKAIKAHALEHGTWETARQSWRDVVNRSRHLARRVVLMRDIGTDATRAVATAQEEAASLRRELARMQDPSNWTIGLKT